MEPTAAYPDPSAVENVIVIGSDHAGYTLKQTLTSHLQQNGFTVADIGTDSDVSVDYPDIAQQLAIKVQSNGSRGILICGTGIGMAIAANRFRGIRAANVSEPFTAAAAKAHNNANVICLGSRVIGSELALAIVDTWLRATFEGGRHSRRVTKLDQQSEGKVLR